MWVFITSQRNLAKSEDEQNFGLVLLSLQLIFIVVANKDPRKFFEIDYY